MLFCFSVQSFEEISDTIRKTYAGCLSTDKLESFTLTPETESYLENITKTYAGTMPFHLQYKLKHYRYKGDIAGSVSILFDVDKDLVKALLSKKDEPERVLKYMRKRF